MRFLIRHLLHKAELCGEEEQCPGAVFDCGRCGHEWRRFADICPRCKAEWKFINVEHGPECPQTMLLESGMQSRMGSLIRRASRIQQALKMGFRLGLEDVTAEEFRVMCAIDDEAGKKKA